MKKILLFALFLFLTPGCISPFSKGLGKLGKGEPSVSVPDASDTAKYIESVQALELAQKKALDEANLKYEKIKKELSSAYEIRQKIDYSSFDYISQVNYGIFYLSKEYAENKDLYLIHLKAEENMNRLTPLEPNIKAFIEKEIEQERTQEFNVLKDKYAKLIEQSRTVYSQWEKADNKVKELEAQKVQVQTENSSLIRKMEMDKVKALADIESAAKLAEERAKNEQLKEIRGWMAKVFAGVAVIAIIAGILLKSVTFIVPGLICGGMALAVTVIPMWSVFVFLGVAMVGMLLLDPKKGKFNFHSAEKEKV
jgi:hypothetical protein